jgi:hypothetical protein
MQSSIRTATERELVGERGSGGAAATCDLWMCLADLMGAVPASCR